MYVRKQVIFFFKEENYLNRAKLIRRSRSPYTVASQLKQNRLYFVWGEGDLRRCTQAKIAFFLFFAF